MRHCLEIFYHELSMDISLTVVDTLSCLYTLYFSTGMQFHECPERAIRNVVKECFRLLRPGGTFSVTDNSVITKLLMFLNLNTNSSQWNNHPNIICFVLQPKSKKLQVRFSSSHHNNKQTDDITHTLFWFFCFQELPPVLFTLMKSTEPFLDEYYLTDLEGVMREAGFVNVQSVLTDPRHRTVTATVPYWNFFFSSFWFRKFSLYLLPDHWNHCWNLWTSDTLSIFCQKYLIQMFMHIWSEIFSVSSILASVQRYCECSNVHKLHHASNTITGQNLCNQF